MINLRYIFRLVTAFLIRFKALILIFIALGAVLFILLRYLFPIIFESKGERVGLTGRFGTNSLPPEVVELIGDGLTKVDRSGSVEPNLASSWETPDGGKTWIFTLRQDVSWQDGKKLVSSDIVYDFSDVKVSRPDDKTLTFELSDPYSAFPSVVAKPVFKKGLLGTGEWKVKKLSLRGAYVDQIVIVKKNSPKITYKFYPTEERTKLAFKLGEVDEVRGLIDPSPFDGWKGAKISTEVTTGEFIGVLFNTQDALLSEKNIRQALTYAINKENFDGLRALGPISVDSWAYNSQVKPYNYDPEKAGSMIEDYKEESKAEEISINLETPPLLLSQAENIAKDWEAVGVKTNVNVISNFQPEYQALLAIYDIPTDPDQYSIWHSTQTSSNITHYQNPRIDKLLEDGRSQMATEERKKIYLDFQRFLVEDSPAAFLYYPSTYTVKR